MSAEGWDLSSVNGLVSRRGVAQEAGCGSTAESVEPAGGEEGEHVYGLRAMEEPLVGLLVCAEGGYWRLIIADEAGEVRERIELY